MRGEMDSVTQRNSVAEIRFDSDVAYTDPYNEVDLDVIEGPAGESMARDTPHVARQLEELVQVLLHPLAIGVAVEMKAVPGGPADRTAHERQSQTKQELSVRSHILDIVLRRPS